MQGMLPFGNEGVYQGMWQGIPYNGMMNMTNQGEGYPDMISPQTTQSNQANPFQGFPVQGMPFQNGAFPLNGYNGTQQSTGGGMGIPPNGFSSQMNMFQQTPFMNPYPTQNQPKKASTTQTQTFMNQFKGQDGNVDMKKMMDTAGQMMNTVNQLNNMVKGLAATFKA